MNNEHTGKIITVSGPSGVGKNTLVNHLLETRDDLSFAVSATCRPMREGDVEGKTYYFLSQEEFKKKMEQGEFLEWFENYPGWYYGTLWSEVKRLWSEGKHFVSDIDVMGALNIKKEVGDTVLTIFIQPPSVEELEQRLRARGSEDEESLEKRLDRAEMEIGKADEFDVCIVNDDLDQAKKEIVQAVRDFLDA